ncbi:hypothetical protein [Fervidibacillus albus]|uniref:Uncharacterized protein n=1 Tax=Fervidibacillus albus TaxID=2980026 RepID=A0A9E8LTF5_9BACI|nr:hypothetical protein [Fervidibacillus albus]WAA09312.1 hypothetical protein OE104_12180 [Fervidibacillus albus]
MNNRIFRMIIMIMIGFFSIGQHVHGSEKGIDGRSGLTITGIDEGFFQKLWEAVKNFFVQIG